jgi:hypothetical protein
MGSTITTINNPIVGKKYKILVPIVLRITDKSWYINLYDDDYKPIGHYFGWGSSFSENNNKVEIILDSGLQFVVKEITYRKGFESSSYWLTVDIIDGFKVLSDPKFDNKTIVVNGADLYKQDIKGYSFYKCTALLENPIEVKCDESNYNITCTNEYNKTELLKDIKKSSAQLLLDSDSDSDSDSKFWSKCFFYYDFNQHSLHPEKIEIFPNIKYVEVV